MTFKAKYGAGRSFTTREAPVSTPSTEAGRAYLAEWEPADGPDDTVERVILAIEAEAKAAGRAEALGEAAKFALHTPFCQWVQRGLVCDCGYNDLLAALTTETKGDGDESLIADDETLDEAQAE